MVNLNAPAVRQRDIVGEDLMVAFDPTDPDAMQGAAVDPVQAVIQRLVTAIYVRNALQSLADNQRLQASAIVGLPGGAEIAAMLDDAIGTTWREGGATVGQITDAIAAHTALPHAHQRVYPVVETLPTPTLDLRGYAVNYLGNVYFVDAERRGPLPTVNWNEYVDVLFLGVYFGRPNYPATATVGQLIYDYRNHIWLSYNDSASVFEESGPPANWLGEFPDETDADAEASSVGQLAFYYDDNLVPNVWRVAGFTGTQPPLVPFWHRLLKAGDVPSTDRYVESGEVSGTTLTLQRSGGLTPVVITGLPSGGGATDGVVSQLVLSLDAQNRLIVTASRTNGLGDVASTALVLPLPTMAQVKTLYEQNPDTNAYTDNEKSKLAGVEDDATADQTADEIKALYESNADTNVFDDAADSKLSGIEDFAKDDQTPAEIKVAYESNGNTNPFTDAEQTKLGNLNADRQLPATTPGQNIGQVPKVQPDGSYALSDDDVSGGSGVDGVANSLSAAVSGQQVNLTIGRSNNLGNLTASFTIPGGGSTPVTPNSTNMLYGRSATRTSVALDSQNQTMTSGVSRSITFPNVADGQFYVIEVPAGWSLTHVLDALGFDEVGQWERAVIVGGIRYTTGPLAATSQQQPFAITVTED